MKEWSFPWSILLPIVLKISMSLLLHTVLPCIERHHNQCHCFDEMHHMPMIVRRICIITQLYYQWIAELPFVCFQLEISHSAQKVPTFAH